EPVGVRSSAEAGDDRRGTLQVGPVVHALDAEHPLAGLIVEAEHATEQAAVLVVAVSETGGAGKAPALATPAAATLDTDIKTGPGRRGCDIRHRRSLVRTCSHISGACRSEHAQNSNP